MYEEIYNGVSGNFFTSISGFMVTQSKHSKGNSYFGLSIGLVIIVGLFTVGPISGGLFNLLIKPLWQWHLQ